MSICPPTFPKGQWNNIQIGGGEVFIAKQNKINSSYGGSWLTGTSMIRPASSWDRPAKLLGGNPLTCKNQLDSPL